MARQAPSATLRAQLRKKIFKGVGELTNAGLGRDNHPVRSNDNHDGRW